ncbi:MAG: hypothetical protein KDE27_17500 [Planctomycetes bacterium]|nr:hypothetical protein [Planctomycetota bacterium]
MRHQSARAVFVTCLGTACAVAQAPFSPNSPELASLLGDLGTRTAAETTAPSAAPVATVSGGLRHETWSVPTLATGDAAIPSDWVPPRPSVATRQDPMSPQDPDYSMRGMFLQSHGMFMAGRERFDPMVEFGLGAYPNQRIKNEPGSFDMLLPTFDAEVPLTVSTEGYVLIGAYYHSRHYMFSSSTTLPDETLYGTGVKLGFGAFLDENMLLEGKFAPGLFSDLDATAHLQDYDVPSSLLLTWRTDPSLYVKLGVRYNQVYEDAPILPYIGLSWDITGTITPPGSEYASSDSWRLDILLPEYAEVSYWLNSATGFSLGAQIDGAQYHVRTSRASGHQRDNVQVQEVKTYLGYTQRFSDNFSLLLRTGAVVAGDYKLTTGAANFQRVDGSLDPGFFAQVTFGIDW